MAEVSQPYHRRYNPVMRIRLVRWLAILIALGVGLSPLAHAQSPPAPAITAQPDAAPSPTSEVVPTPPGPLPTPAPPTNPWRQLWQTYRELIIPALITAFVGSVLVGVFLNRIAGRLADWAGRLFHWLFDRVAGIPLVRWRYEQAYRATLAASVQELQGGALIARSMRLDQMYVTSLLTEEMRVETGLDFADRFRSQAERRDRQRQRAVGPWEAIRRSPRLVVLGDPGAGKTTYLYHLAFMCAHRRRPEVARHIPIFIRFRELVQDLNRLERLEDIFPRVFKDNNFPNADQFIERRLRQGRCLILLDGLDEVPNEADHQRMVALTQAFARRWVREGAEGDRSNILVISSRTYSYERGEQLEGFTKTEMMEFDTPAIEIFAHNWFSGDQRPLAAELLTVLQGNPRFLELASNPLLLVLIAAHYERERNLPALRAELYRHCIRTRITQWNTMRGTHRGRFGEQIKWNMLGELALHLFRNEEQGLLSRRDLLTWLEAFAAEQRLPAGASSEDLLDEIARTSGLLQEWAIERYGFSHQTLQEFFAADAIYQLGPEQGADQLGPHLSRSAWKEVILLYSGLTKNAEPLLKRIMGEAQQAAESKPLWLLAGQCLAEGAPRSAPALRQALTAQLLAMLQAPPAEMVLTPAEQGQAIDHLQAFAAEALPAQVRALLDSGDAPALFLAERLLPAQAEPALRAELAQRLTALARPEAGEQQQAAIAALGRLGGGGAAAAAALLKGLADADPRVRAEAALALGRLGTVEDATAAALRRVYETDAADAARHAALDALLAVGRAAEVGMVGVPAGEFLMGSADADRLAHEGEKPQHRLYLPAYYIDRAPVTNAQYRGFMAAGGYANPTYWSEAAAAGYWQTGRYRHDQPRYWDDPQWNSDQQPVVGVDWYEALAYARWSGKRLPTEAEWEKAARGTDGRIYPWGDAWDTARLNSQASGLGRTTPVGQFSPAGNSPYGAVDMAGNVWEWCSTRVGGAYPYTPDDGREDLSGGDSVWRTLRGGSWFVARDRARAAVRLRYVPNFRDSSYGFRVARRPPSHAL